MVQTQISGGLTWISATHAPRMARRQYNSLLMIVMKIGWASITHLYPNGMRSRLRATIMARDKSLRAHHQRMRPIVLPRSQVCSTIHSGWAWPRGGYCRMWDAMHHVPKTTRGPNRYIPRSGREWKCSRLLGYTVDGPGRG